MVASKKGDDDGYFYTAYITLRNGRRLYASQKGLKVFRIPKGPRKPPKAK